VSAVAPLLVLVPDPVERGEFARRLALAIGAEAADVAAALRRERQGEAPEPAPAPPRRMGAEDRHYATLLRLLIDHPAELASLDEAGLLELAPDPDWRALAAALLAAPVSTLTSLVDELEGEPRRRFSELANEPRPELDAAEHAAKIYFDTLAKLQKTRLDQANKQLTARIASGEVSLIEKQHQLDERRRLSRNLSAG
jgi:CelD/BcsL family acetyltransferase involved in cellulose biosynthesis